MKAIVHSRYGPPDVLELKDIDKPVVNDDDVLVRVHAAAVGKGDWLTVGGLPYVARMRYGLPKPSTLFRASTWPGALRRPAAT
jgi:NADPH:quinone reductase-like Zn-dependent oxidoreductase